jgi:hypothetical protein
MKSSRAAATAAPLLAVALLLSGCTAAPTPERPAPGGHRAERQHDRRYRAATGVLDRAKGALGTQRSVELLRTVAQSHTQWSVVYGMKSGRVTLVPGQRRRTRHTFALPME